MILTRMQAPFRYYQLSFFRWARRGYLNKKQTPTSERPEDASSTQKKGFTQTCDSKRVDDLTEFKPQKRRDPRSAHETRVTLTYERKLDDLQFFKQKQTEGASSNAKPECYMQMYHNKCNAHFPKTYLKLSQANTYLTGARKPSPLKRRKLRRHATGSESII